MKRKIALISILILVLLSTVIISFATETSDELEDDVSINVEDVVGTDDSYELESGASINVEDIVGTDLEESESVTNVDRGDLFVVEDEANVTENIDGNLFVIADNVEISGNVDGSIFVIGTNVNINSNITGSAFVLAENINFECGQIKDAYFGGKEIDIFEDALISREAKMMADIISIDGTISGDLYSEEEEITVSDTGRITGKLVYSGTLSQATEDSIGSLEKIETDTTETVVQKVSTFEKVLTKTFTALVIIGLIVLVSNKEKEEDITAKTLVKGVFGGILWIILIPIISLLLIVTIIGIPVSLILLMIYVVLFFVVFPAVSIQISSCILKSKNNSSKVKLWLVATVAYFVLALIREIPTIGTIVTILVGTYGFNLIIKSIFKKNKKEMQDKKEVVETNAQKDKDVEVKDEN